ncbi:restriction endonuclease subunit S [Candidatus Omnitrophus magneticus]|uniref:Restriction endonuclease subunit S n=1 Tax=Candidatus Omnitrophus magneticus TaxID=1609969 RepID=A0A0F0CQG4_9BACT|nr:restriction endonuclease subunit S [Candidatus Omnitrophus magneticus]
MANREQLKQAAVGDYIELVYGGGLPERNRKRGKYPVYGSNGVVGYHDQSLVQGPGIIVGRKGTVGQVTLSKSDFWPIDTTYYVKLKRDGDIFFWFYLLQTLGLSQMNSHSAVPGLNRDNVYNIVREIPCPAEQRSIAKILCDLDEKIELNHQMNKTLEAIGQALFKRWFVDFEFPGHEKTRVVNGVPDGWRKGNLIEISDLLMGQSPPGDTYNEQGDGVVFYQGNRDFGFRFPTPRVYCTAPTRMAEALDVLISVRAPVGAINITMEKCAIGRGVAALRMKHFSNGFLFYFLSTRSDLWDRFNSEGTVFGCLNKAEFQKVDLVIPSDAALKQFDSVIKPIEAMIRKNETENRLLVGIRDSLMPKLMSGKIRVNT